MTGLSRFWQWYRQSWLFNLSILILIGIVLTVFLDKVGLPFYVKLGEETEMPDVIEMPVGQARALLSQHGFNVLVSDSLYDAHHPVGTIIEQNPYPYATVKEGRRVYLTISIGHKPILMPNLFGVSFHLTQPD